MDLLTTVRKEGSRGGRGDFKWSDVQSSTHRENYLGHSLMAPVGRWQTGRDLNWYAKGDASDVGGETSAEKAARERREEIKQIKEAEQDALARALGYDVPPRNPSLTSLGDRKEVDKMVKESVEDGDTGTGRGLGFGKLGAIQIESDERIEDNGEVIRIGGLEASRRNGSERRRNRSRDRRHRSRSQSRNRDRQRRRREKREDDGSRRSRSMSREHTRRRRPRSRSRHRDERGDQKWRDRRSYRSRSPYYSGRHSRGDYYDKRRP